MILRIDGTTRLAGVIGWPLGHSLSPAMHNAAYQALGLDWAYVPLPVRDLVDLPKVVSGLRALDMVGFNVTMPYKRVMLDICDEVAAQARLAGAVNTVHVCDGVLLGYNTDGRGLLQSLQDETGFIPEGKRAVVIGTGGAAGAVIVALVLAGASHVTVLSRDPRRAEAALEHIRSHARDCELVGLGPGPEGAAFVQAADLVVNATPLGMDPADGSPVPAHWLRAGQIVSDMTYKQPVTALMRAAADAGATPVGGLGMLVEQGAIALQIWKADTHTKAPRDIMRAAAEAAMAERREASATGTGGA